MILFTNNETRYKIQRDFAHYKAVSNPINEYNLDAIWFQNETTV